MIVVAGPSGVGKSTIVKKMEERGFKRVVTYTTRPKRENEIEDVDYHYISQEEYDRMSRNKEFVEEANYRGWYYGMSKASCTDDMNTVVILTPSGFRKVLKAGFKVISFYFKIDRVSRFFKIVDRGDNFDEAYRRNVSDEGMFSEFEHEVDCVIENDGYKLSEEEVLQEILDYLKEN